MRIRVGRTLRIAIALGIFILMIPFLMFKLESSTDQVIPENIQVVDLQVNIIFVCFFDFACVLSRRGR